MTVEVAVLLLPSYGSFEAISRAQTRVTHAECEIMKLELIVMLEIACIKWCELLFV